MILTIGIPTYNRSEKLYDCLNNITSQINNCLECKVSIIVADNCSTDNTTEVVSTFVKKFKNIEILYHKHQFNLGYDKNVNSLFNLSKSDYVMPLSDDDGLEDNAIREIIRHIEENFGVNVFYISNNYYNNELTERVPITDPFFLNVGVNMYFKNGYELFKCSNEIFGGISGICVKRSTWKKFEPSKFFDTDWVHLGVVLSIIKKLDIYVIFDPYIKYRLGNKNNRWSPFVSLGIQRVLLQFKDDFPHTIKKIYAEHRHQTRLSLIHLDRKQTIKNKLDIFKKMKLSYDTSTLSFWLIDFMLLLVPSILTKTLYNIYKEFKFKKQRNPI